MLGLKQVFAAAGQALDHNDVIEAFADWCERRRFGERAIRAQTVREYKTAAPDAKLTSKAAVQLSEFLAESALHGLSEDAIAAIDTLQAAIAPLVAKEREAMYAEPLDNDTMADLKIEAFQGAYAVWRYETGGPQFQQELLLMHGRRVKGRWITKATYVRPQIVYRGSFHVLEGVLSCTLGGYPMPTTGRAPNGHPKANKLLITRDGADRTDILCGVLTGVATGNLVALVMPFVMVRVGVTPDMEAIAAVSDAELAKAIEETDAAIDIGDPRHTALMRVVDMFNEPNFQRGTPKIALPYRPIDSHYIDAIRPMLRDERVRQQMLGEKFHAWLARAGRRERPPRKP